MNAQKKPPLFHEVTYQNRATNPILRDFILFNRNPLDIRVIDRFGVETWDTAAVIAGELTFAFWNLIGKYFYFTTFSQFLTIQLAKFENA